MKYFSPKLLNRMKRSRATCQCAQGHIHDSRGEASYCNILQLRQRAGDIKSYERQKTYSFDINGKHICSHRVDFVVTNREGRQEVHEYKGFPTPEWAIKRKLFEALYPEIQYLVIKGVL